jgi:hypothetical protein
MCWLSHEISTLDHHSRSAASAAFGLALRSRLGKAAVIGGRLRGARRHPAWLLSLLCTARATDDGVNTPDVVFCCDRV